MKKLGWMGVLSWGLCPLFADLSIALNQLIHQQKNGEELGVYVENVETGAPLYAYNANHLMTPASTTKMFTAAAAYLYLGPQYRFVTSIASSAPVASVLKGNVYVDFSGDPTLTAFDLYELTDQLKGLGIHEIEGNVVVDQTLFSGSYYGQNWAADDFGHCYAAPISAAIINSNCIGGVAVKNTNVYASHRVVLALAAVGIHVHGQVVDGGTPANVHILAVHYSKPLSDILSYMLKYSDDVYANALIKTIGHAYYNVGSYQEGVMAANVILMDHIGKSFRPFHLTDGSGLSVTDALSPEQLVQILHYMFHNPSLANLFIRSLPISGEGGTLVYRLTMHPFLGHVYAKTGTFEHDNGGVSSLSGYLILPGRPVIAFAIMMNHLSGNMFHAQHLQDEIVRELAEAHTAPR